MSVRAMKWAASIKGLSGAKRTVLTVMAQVSDGKGRLIKSLEQIADLAGCARSTAAEAVSSLVQNGLVTKVTRRGRFGRQASSLFCLNMIAPESEIRTLTESDPPYSGQSPKSGLIYKTNTNTAECVVEAEAFFPVQAEEFQGDSAKVIAFPLAKGMGR